VSGDYLTQCSDRKGAISESGHELASQKASLFQGETLPGLLLYGTRAPRWGRPRARPRSQRPPAPSCCWSSSFSGSGTRG